MKPIEKSVLNRHDKGRKAKLISQIEKAITLATMNQLYLSNELVDEIWANVKAAEYLQNALDCLKK